MALRRYRANANVAGVRAGELVEIDPSEPGWASRIERGLLVADDVDNGGDRYDRMDRDDLLELARRAGVEAKGTAAQLRKRLRAKDNETANTGEGDDGSTASGEVPVPVTAGRPGPEPSPTDPAEQW